MSLCIQRVRLGHCCNSSGDHKIAIVANGPVPDAYLDGGFLWNLFTAGTKGSKMAYLAGLIQSSFPGPLGYRVTRDLLGISDDLAIDHQAAIAVPAEWDDPLTIDAQHLHWLTNFLCRPEVAILGGNDEDPPHPLAEQSQIIPFPKAERIGNTVCRQEGTDQWAYFNRNTGALVRVAVQPSAPYYPELLDIKLTNQCSTGCAYCYQDSRPDGVSADPGYLREVADWCHERRVFSVALGGGDTINFENLDRFLEYFRLHGVVPNLTTRREVPRALFQAAGSIAFSVDANNLGVTLRQLEASNPPHHKVVLQVIPAVSLPLLPDVYQICADHGWGVTLLGFKDTGRGYGFEPRYDETRWPIYAVPVDLDLGLDTLLASRSQAQLQRMAVPEVLYDTVDGEYSLYVDAVGQQLGCCSYQPETLVPATNLDDALYKLREAHHGAQPPGSTT